MPDRPRPPFTEIPEPISDRTKPPTIYEKRRLADKDKHQAARDVAKREKQGKKPLKPKKKKAAKKRAGRGVNYQHKEMQDGFVREYLAQPMLDRSPEKAAIAAGYSPKTARTQALKIMKYPEVRRQLLLHSEKVLEITSIDDAWVLNELEGLWNVDLGDLFEDDGSIKHVKDMSIDTQRLITSFDIEYVTTYDTKGDKTTAPKVTRIRILNRLDVMTTIG